MDGAPRFSRNGFTFAIVAALLLLPTLAWFAFPRASPPVRAAAPSSTTSAELEPDLEPLANNPPPRRSQSARANATSAPRRPPSGLVVDADGRPVGGAIVECEGRADLVATTDDNGRFELTADADGCQAIATHEDLERSDAIRLRGGGKNILELRARPKISGNVVDEKGTAIASCTVGVESFTGGDGTNAPPYFKQVKVDDPNGEFTLDDLVPGKYVLVASAPGRPPAKSRSIEVTAGERVRGVQIVLSLGGVLTGRVTDRTTGAPIPSVSVRLDASTSSGGSEVGAATTDREGRFTLSGVPTGNFSVRSRHPDYKDRIVQVDGGRSPLVADFDLAPRGAGGTDLEMVGIGATLFAGSEGVTVGSVLENGPAASADVQAGDVIRSIDGKSTEGFSVADCVQRLRGEEGTRVSVSLLREGAPVNVTITRARIER
ncbi:MAG: carboxypeptidase regulatory-like domain-containing protein [Polyangiaceae bacterium]